MPRRLYVLAVAAGLAAVITLLSPHRVLAAGDCLAQPSEQAAASGHWYYRSDRVGNRRCWHLVESEPTTQGSDVPISPAATPQPTVSSFFSSLITGFATGNPAGTQAPSANSDEGATLGDPSRVEASHGKRPPLARHDDSTAALTSKQQRQSPTRPDVAQSTAQPLTEAERAELFRKFLSWKKEQLSQSTTIE